MGPDVSVLAKDRDGDPVTMAPHLLHQVFMGPGLPLRGLRDDTGGLVSSWEERRTTYCFYILASGRHGRLAVKIVAILFSSTPMHGIWPK